jgi:translation initiation factor 1
MTSDDKRVVYSTGPSGPRHGNLSRCRRCGSAPCRCGPQASLPPEKQSVRVRFERAGRAGKTVTVASPLVLIRADAEELLGHLKRACGSGGTLKEARTPDGKPCHDLEVQGDHVEKVVAELVARGFKARRG